MKRIFVGGLGRSGTTIALNALYRHSDIYAVPIETKFLVEEDGFADLVSAFTDRFSVPGANTAWHRFEHLMRRRVTGLEEGDFRNQHTLSSEVFSDYEAALNSFVAAIAPRRYFPHPAPLHAAVRQFIAATFDAETRRSDKSAWVEKTPANIWRLGFLRQIWPDCWFVHVIRDPRAVLASLMRRGWISPDMGPAVVSFEGHLAATCDVRRRHAEDLRFVTLRLEDLVADPVGALAQLAAKLGFAPFPPAAVAAVREAMDDYYQTAAYESQASAGDQALALELLRPAALELGYPADW